MAFIAQDLSLIVQPIAGVGLRMFSYRTDDSQATLEAADYIPNATRYGVRADDLVFVSQKSGGADPYIMVVSEIDASDNATLVFGDSLELGPYATQAEAIAGVNETRTMNPLRTKQAIDSRILDEDDFASDSAVLAPSQQSTKAYILAGPIIDARRRFNVTGDGVTDDSAAVLSALTYMAANGGSIIFPENCLLSSQVVIGSTSKGFNIIGGSFLVNNATGGIKITTTAVEHTIYWSAHVFANTATAGRPLEIIFPVPSSWRTHTVILDRSRFEPRVLNDSSYRFTNGVRLENAWHGQANKCVFNGAENNNYTSCPIGLELAGYSINFDALSSYATNVTTGFYAGTECEGFRAVFTNAVACDIGFEFEAATGNDPQAVLIGCHTNVRERAVKSTERNSIVIQGCLFYRLGTVAGYKDLEIIGGTGHVITGNSAYLGGSVENWFVHATDVDGMIVRDNYLTGRWHHVQLEGTSRNVSVSNNRQLTLVAASYADELVNNSSGSDNKLLHWKAESYSTTTLNASGTTNDIDTATATAITWATVTNYNEMGGFASGSPTRITPPAWVKSVELSAAIEFASNSTGYRLVTIRRNGSTVVARSSCAPANGTATSVNVAPIRVTHTAGDYYEVVVTQNSGSTLSVASANTRFECRPVS
ncbi:MAG: hypothetical protein M9939_00630 [Mesorhizobium sp.]|nr:hypothetical protein [Mesorhizobium sp.]MCO5159612.1 hypothetical protein [Mesorhizobium sp.]